MADVIMGFSGPMEPILLLIPVSNGAKLGTEWLLSRRDSTIVARHEVPGIDLKRLRPGGTVEVIVSPNVSRIGSNVHRGTGPFSS